MNLKITLIIIVILFIDRVFGALPVVTKPDPLGSTVISIPENTTIGESIFNVLASDADGDTLSYNVVPNSKFSVTNSGVLRVSSPFDYEDANDRNHILTIQVSDVSDTVNVSMTVTVTDVNDNSPQFYPATYAVSTDENTPAGTSLLELNCTDIDSGSNGNCTITIESGDQNPARFDVIGNILYTTVNPIDYETTRNFNLVLNGQDNPTVGSPNTASANVTVTVNDLNEPPTFIDNPTISISENSTSPVNIYWYNGTDKDTFILHQIARYDIVSVTNNGSTTFGIFPFTGIIKLDNPVDYETVNKYEIVVVATDYGSLKGTGTVTVSIQDVNDNTPICSPDTFNISVSDNVARSTVVLSGLSCSDADSGINSQLSYTLIVNPNNKFSITLSGNVVSVVVTGTLDYKTTSFYQLKLEVSDNGVPVLSTTVIVNIDIQASSENTTPWIQTIEGLATTVTCAVLGLVCIIIVTGLIIRFCSKKSVAVVDHSIVHNRQQCIKTVDNVNTYTYLPRSYGKIQEQRMKEDSMGKASYHIIKMRKLSSRMKNRGWSSPLPKMPCEMI